MLYIFELDYAIAESFDGHEATEQARRWHMAHPDAQVAVISNAGGVGMRHWMETRGFGNPADYPTEAQVRGRQAAILREWCADDNGQAFRDWQEISTFLSFAYRSRKGYWSPAPDGSGEEWSKSFRLPNPGMILAAMDWANEHNPACVMVVGGEWACEAGQAIGTVCATPAAFFAEFDEVQVMHKVEV